MSFKAKGKIEEILSSESGTSKAGKDWKKQEFVIETDEQYPRKICFTLFNDKTSLIEPFNKGDEVEVSFNIESREYNGRWFHNVNAWRIDNASQSGMPDVPPEFQASDVPPPTMQDDEANDLPF